MFNKQNFTKLFYHMALFIKLTNKHKALLINNIR